MIPCNGKHKAAPWMRVLCCIGIHWHGRTDGGMMGDCNQCHICFADSYGPIGWIVHDESKEEEPPMKYFTEGELRLWLMEAYEAGFERASRLTMQPMTKLDYEDRDEVTYKLMKGEHHEFKNNR